MLSVLCELHRDFLTLTVVVCISHHEIGDTVDALYLPLWHDISLKNETYLIQN